MQRKILIVEANPPLADLWRAYLSKNGFDARCFIKGSSQAGDFDGWGVPDIIVSGLEFSDSIPSGEQLCHETLGRKPSGKSLLPLIQLYSLHLSESQMANLKGSAFRLLRKPVPLPLLLDSVRKAYFKSLSRHLQQGKAPLMSSDLSGQALAGMLQSIESGNGYGIVLAESPAGGAFMSFHSGKLVDAECGHLSGEEAALEMLSWTSGEASLYGAKPDLRTEAELLPGVKSLLGESIRQRDEISRIEKLLSNTFCALHRNPEAKISGRAPFSEQVYIALESSSDLEGLEKRLPSLTRRQLLATLAGMLERGEVIFTGGGDASALSPRACKSFLAALSAGAGSVVPSPSLSIPPIVGVYSASSRLAKRFIGALGGASLAPAALLSLQRQHLLLCETCPGCWSGLESLSSAILIFDRTDPKALPKSKAFLEHISNTKISIFCVAVPPQPSPAPPVPLSELLGLADTSIKVVNFDWTPASCLSVLSALLETALEKEA